MRAQDLLPDRLDRSVFQGVTVRKGTVGAFLVNAGVWTDTSASPASRAEAERDILEALPALGALGLFRLLEVRDPALRALVSAGLAGAVTM